MASAPPEKSLPLQDPPPYEATQSPQNYPSGHPTTSHPGYPVHQGYATPSAYPSVPYSPGNLGFVQQPPNAAAVADARNAITHTVTQTVVLGSLGPHPTQYYCHSCQRVVLTKVSRKSGTCAWLSCFVICMVGCWLGCCLIPFCADGCSDFKHRCPDCKNVVGYSKRI